MRNLKKTFVVRFIDVSVNMAIKKQKKVAQREISGASRANLVNGTFTCGTSQKITGGYVKNYVPKQVCACRKC